MRKRMKKIVSVLLITAMTVVMLAGCSSTKTNSENTSKSTDSQGSKTDSADNETTAVDTSEHLDLTMYLLGDRTPDFDEVYGKINEVLEEKLNCSLNV